MDTRLATLRILDEAEGEYHALRSPIHTDASRHPHLFPVSYDMICQDKTEDVTPKLYTFAMQQAYPASTPGEDNCSSVVTCSKFVRMCGSRAARFEMQLIVPFETSAERIPHYVRRFVLSDRVSLTILECVTEVS